MKPQEFLEAYLKLLWDAITYDFEVMSQTEMYVFLCIPAFFYFIFMCFKWCFLFFPFFVPAKIMKHIFTGVAKAIKSEK